MIFRQAIQIGDNVTDILKLPCVKGVKKCDDKAGFEWLMYILKWGDVGWVTWWFYYPVYWAFIIFQKV